MFTRPVPISPPPPTEFAQQPPGRAARDSSVRSRYQELLGPASRILCDWETPSRGCKVLPIGPPALPSTCHAVRPKEQVYGLQKCTAKSL
ncbi:hypothetical protein G6O67_006989 [Ophiocordyceps sinensis]|uniref:Uncharacterized protein n=1 Tax=Ophiocordyceps sinensis TaxID=72228 RepID=A0A8H4LSX2_9HYPO|nr:hypothetical protein G6O67_006989 [Ophiocordyceps sinensis]